MASNSTTYSRNQVVLPSIHDMFPEHLIRGPAPSPAPSYIVAPQLPHRGSNFSFDVLKSDPRSPSLTHLASSGSGPSEADGEIGEEDGDDGDADDGYASLGEGRRHVCPTCAKRFNRPSSLRIHVNTHTGATPFRCPHPGCGRAFNVNSNMRRHYRNHGVPIPSPFSAPAAPVSLPPLSVAVPLNSFNPFHSNSPSCGSATASRPYSPPSTSNIPPPNSSFIVYTPSRSNLAPSSRSPSSDSAAPASHPTPTSSPTRSAQTTPPSASASDRSAHSTPPSRPSWRLAPAKWPSPEPKTGYSQSDVRSEGR